MNINLNATKHQLLASIAREVASTGDDHKVFQVTQQVLNEYRKTQGQDMARLVYEASRSAQKNSVFKAGFAKLAKRRDTVLEAINLARAVHGFQKYTLDDLGVWSTQMEIAAGAKVWQSIHTHHELVEVFGKDRAQLDLLLAWGRTLSHGDEGLAAAKAMPAGIKAAYRDSLLGIGKAMKAKGKTDNLVSFEGGWAVEWAVDSYKAAMDPEGKKPGLVLRGVSDAIKAAINSAYYLERRANDTSYELSFISQGHKEAWHILNPKDGEATLVHKGTDGDERLRDFQRKEERLDADYGSEDYAGAESILLQTPWRTIDMGSNPSAAELQEAQGVAAGEYQAAADDLLAGAELMFGYLSCGIKHGDHTFDAFHELKEVLYMEAEARTKVRREAKAFDKALSKAIMVTQVAMKMDAVSRRTFLAGFKDRLPLDTAVAYLAEQRKVAEPSAEELAAQAKAAELDALAAETERRAKEREATAEARKAEAAAYARRGAQLDAEMAALRAKAGA